MGNCCGKESTDAFSQPGRTLNSAPPPNTRSSIPKKVGGPARTLGSSTSGPQSSAQQEDARRKAAEAAEVSTRAQAFTSSMRAVTLIE